MNFEKPPIEEVLMHYGVGHLQGGHSGRFPWGSGDEPFQRPDDFLSRVKELKKEKHFTYYDAEEGKTYTGEAAIAKACGVASTTDLRKAMTLAKNLERMATVNRAESLKASGLNNNQIAKEMGINESTVRSLLDPQAKANMMRAQETADFIAAELNKKLESDPKAMIDIGLGVEDELGISRKKLDDAIYILEGSGYTTNGGRIRQVTDPTGARQTTLNVIGGADMEAKDIYDYAHIYSLKDYITRDNGETYVKKFEYPESMDISRLQIRYAEDGGIDKDGVIELRRGVDDLSLGESNYAQVRILVDGDRYLKGMAVYSDNMPDGIDVVFNTNKTKDVAVRDVMKKVKDDPDNPFGSLIKDAEQGGQYHYIGEDGKEHLGLINKRSDEGDWKNWSDTLSSQFLSKQPIQLAKKQLNEAIEEKKKEYEEILNLTNGTVRKYYLETFADDCDTAAVTLKAAALPRQKYQVLLPVTSLKDNEIYAPNYENGEQVALIRYPHGGTFEIPICTVNNNNKEGKKLIGTNSKDAVGINSHVAGRLSGADFDGDTAMVIPTGKNGINIKSTASIVKDFDPKTSFATTEKNGKYYNAQGKEIKVMTNTQTEMGMISNLITDMTIKGAKADELAKAVKHSMVVIDAEKHKLDYQSSEQQFDIKQLKDKYQGRVNENGNWSTGASTLISKASSEVQVPKRKGQASINIKGKSDYDPSRPEGALLYKTQDEKDLIYYTAKNPETGANINVYPDGKGGYKYIASKSKNERGNTVSEYKTLPETYTKTLKSGKTKTVENKVTAHTRTENSTKMAETDDATTLISEYNSPVERLYANFANTMKSMANTARKEMYYTKGVEYKSDAAKVYSNEVEELNTKLLAASKNKPRERQAQIIATSRVNAKKESNPGMTKADEKKLRQQEVTKARSEVGAQRTSIDITDREWEAIQAGAVHSTTLTKILGHTDMDTIKQKATPRNTKDVTDTMVARAKAYKANGRTNAEIAKALGVSASTISEYLNG